VAGFCTQCHNTRHFYICDREFWCSVELEVLEGGTKLERNHLKDSLPKILVLIATSELVSSINYVGLTAVTLG
jgi:hypothetical protein